MATRNRTLIFRKYRDALKSVRVPSSSSPSTSTAGGGGGGGARGPVIELASTSLLNPNHRNYTPLSTEDPGNSRYKLTYPFAYTYIPIYYSLERYEIRDLFDWMWN